MKRLCLSFSSSFALFSMLAGCLAGCSSDAPSSTGTGGSSAGSLGVAGKPGSGGSAPASGGSASGGSGNTGSMTGGSSSGGASGGTGPAAGGSATMTAGSSTGGSATAGSSTGGASGGSVGGGGAPANAILSADFESDEVGKQPGGGWHNFIAYNVDAMNPQSGLQAIVDATRPHGGKNSLHVKSNGSPAFLTLPLPANINKLYVRGYFYMTRQLGQNPGANHETLFGIRKDKDTEIRFGEIKGVLGVNEVPSDNITPKMDQWGKGPLIAANKWVCIEGAFLGDKAQHEVHGWADGTEVITVTSGDQWQNGFEPATFLNGYWKEFMIGWQSFSSAANEIWIDDLVLSSTRVNCQ